MLKEHSLSHHVCVLFDFNLMLYGKECVAGYELQNRTAVKAMIINLPRQHSHNFTETLLSLSTISFGIRFWCQCFTIITVER